MGKGGQEGLENHVSGQSNKPMSAPAHALKWTAVSEELQANTDIGLTGGEAKKRLEEYGKNELGETGGVNPGKILLRQIANAMTLVLIMAMAVSFGIRSWIEGGVIAAVIAINIIVGFVRSRGTFNDCGTLANTRTDSRISGRKDYGLTSIPVIADRQCRS